MNDTFIYELKDSLMTKSELSYYNAIVKALPTDIIYSHRLI